MANKYGYMAKIGIDTSGLQASLKDVDTAVKGLSREMKSVDNVIRQSGESAEMTAQKNEIYAQEVAQLTQKLTSLKSVEGSILSARDSGNISAEQYREYQREVTSTEAALRRLTDEQKKLGKATEETAQKALTLEDIVKANVISDIIVKGAEKVTDALKQISSEAIAAYSQYEQLTGGVETLFAGAEDTVIANAQNAYKTAGISANSYMETVTGFSATLLQGLSGDTQKAAEIADRALIDMSDNANKMGTAMGSIRYAYQGFAKQNYTMLDNLKLGYGGSQAEMARLINDSGVLNGQMVATAKNVKEIPFDKIIEAIHVIQTNLGITGTTALEAETTLEGSMNKLKASWENALVEIAEPLDDFAQGGLTVLNDNVDEVKEALVSTMEEIKPLLDDALEKAENWIESGGLKELSENIVGTVEFIINNKETLLGIFAALELALGTERISKAVSGLKDVTSAINGMGNAANTAVGGVDAMSMSLSGWIVVATAAIATAMTLANAIDKAAEKLGEHSDEVNALEERTAAINEQKKALEELSKTDSAAAWRQANGDYKDTLVELAEISRRFEELKAKRESGGTVNENGGFTYFTDEEIRAMDDELMSLEIQKNALISLKREQNQLLTQYNEQEIAVMEQHNAEKEDIISKSGNTAETAVASAWEHIRETTKAKMEEYDSDLATHKIDDNTYWAQRKAYLEAHRDEESEEWWKYYDAVTDHYDKLSKTEKTAADKAAKEAESAAKDSYSKRYEALKRQQKENGYDDSWLADELKKMISELSEGSDLYNTYYDKWLDLTDKISDATEKATEKEVKEWKNSADKVSDAVEKKYEKVQQAFEKAKSSYISALDMSASDKSEDDVYSRMGLVRPKSSGNEDDTDNQYDFSSENINKQTKELDEYTRNMEKLENSDIPEEYLENIRAMSFDKRKEYVKELLRLSPERLKKHYADISRYYQSAERAGRSDTQSLKDDADKAALAAKGSIQKSLSELGSDAYESGKAAAEAYWKGFAEYKSDTEKLMGVTAAGNSKSAGITTPVNLTINVNGKQAATISTEEYLNQVKNQGGTLDV